MCCFYIETESLTGFEKVDPAGLIKSLIDVNFPILNLHDLKYIWKKFGVHRERLVWYRFTGNKLKECAIDFAPDCPFESWENLVISSGQVVDNFGSKSLARATLIWVLRESRAGWDQHRERWQFKIITREDRTLPIRKNITPAAVDVSRFVSLLPP